MAASGHKRLQSEDLSAPPGLVCRIYRAGNSSRSGKSPRYLPSSYRRILAAEGRWLNVIVRVKRLRGCEAGIESETFCAIGDYESSGAGRLQREPSRSGLKPATTLSRCEVLFCAYNPSTKTPVPRVAARRSAFSSR